MFKSIILTLGILIMVASFVFAGSSYVNAAVFMHGGLVTNSFYCNCSGNFLLTLGPPTTGQWVWYPSTPQFANFQLPRVGVWTLGLYTPVGVCLVYSGTSCTPVGAPIGTIGPINGTSF